MTRYRNQGTKDEEEVADIKEEDTEGEVNIVGDGEDTDQEAMEIKKIMDTTKERIHALTIEQDMEETMNFPKKAVEWEIGAILAKTIKKMKMHGEMNKCLNMRLNLKSQRLK
jgi:hypothetical protein